MDHPDLIVSNFMENSIGLKGVNDWLLRQLQEQWWLTLYGQAHEILVLIAYMHKVTH